MKKPKLGMTVYIAKAICWLIAGGVVVWGGLSIIAPQQLQELGSLLDPPGSQSSDQITIATASKLGLYYRIGNFLREDLEQGTTDKVTVLNSEGSIENTRLVREGKADFALIQGGLPTEHLHDLVGVAHVTWQYLHVVVRRDAPFRSFRDLAGKTIGLGPPESGNATLGKQLCRFYWSETEIDLRHEAVADLQDELASDTIDAALLVYDFHAPVVERLLNTGAYRLLPIEEAEALTFAIPGTFMAQIPAGTYGPGRTIPDEMPLHTIKTKTLLVTHKNTSRFAVQRVLQALYSPTFLKRSRLVQLDEQVGRNVRELPLHLAADRFYKRNEPITADRFEIGSAVLAVLLFAGSVTSFLSRRAHEGQLDKMRRRIVPHFESLLKSSEELAIATETDQLQQLLEDMMHTLQKAEGQWLKGELDTEHMENLYTIYGIHCRNGFAKMQQILLERRMELLQQLGNKAP